MPKPRAAKPEDPRGEVLVAILNRKADFAILQEQRWYRIPIASAPRRWPPRWLAWYQTKVFGPEAYAVNYYARVLELDVVERRDLFPNELDSQRARRQYYKIRVEKPVRRDPPIRSPIPRRLVFLPTTWAKFQSADALNDLFDDSPLEDQVWDRLKQADITAERQWVVATGQQYYQLDFAIFCRDGQIDVEADGDTWHSQPDAIQHDNERNNALAIHDWRVLRFNGKDIHEPAAPYVTRITEMINRLGGLPEGLVPRRFYPLPGGLGQQLALFDRSPTAYLEPEPDLDD